MDTVKGILESLSFDSTTFFFQVMLFFILHYTLKFTVYNPLLAARNARDSKIATRLAEAESLTATARRLKDEYEEQIRALRQESQVAVHAAIEKSEKEAARTVSKAREQASALLEDAQKKVAAERSKAQGQLEGQATAMARKLAERLLVTNMSSKGAELALARLGGKS